MSAANTYLPFLYSSVPFSLYCSLGLTFFVSLFQESFLPLLVFQLVAMAPYFDRCFRPQPSHLPFLYTADYIPCSSSTRASRCRIILPTHVLLPDGAIWLVFRGDHSSCSECWTGCTGHGSMPSLSNIDAIA